MYKQLIADMRIRFCVIAEEPLLIKSGSATIDGPDMAFVQTFREGRWQCYIPGSSMKGLFRSHAERIMRTLAGEGGACNPFMDKGPGQFCGKRLEKQENAASYRLSCPICRLFGSTVYGSRVQMSDCYLEGAATRQVRDGVGIDRLTGGSSHGAKFDLEVVSGTFGGEVSLRNFELWQVALLGFVFCDLEDGYLRLGSGKSRGLGRIRGEVNEIVVSYVHPGVLAMPAEELWGIGAFTGDNEYGFSNDDRVAYAGRPALEQRGIRSSLCLNGEHIPAFWECLTPAWRRFLTRQPSSADQSRSQVAVGRG